MHHRTGRLWGLCALAAIALLLAGIAGCGSSSSSDATGLLKQTFGGTHKYESGNLNVSLTFNPSGSGTLSGPIKVTVAGPFQSLGAGKPPAASITLNASAMGHTGTIGFVSTGDKGFVTLQGIAYQLPDATFKKYASGLNGLTSSSNTNSGAGLLSKLGVDPMRWVTNPKVAGNETVGGASTTHITAAINVAALLRDLNVVLQKAPSLGITQGATVPTNISPATQAKLANQIKNPGLDVWTGTDDKTARKVAIALTVSVNGQASQVLGGLSSAGIVLSMEYANLNQHQTISPPTNVRPYSEFTTKLRNLAQALQSAVGGGSATSGSSTTPAPSTGAAPPASPTQSNIQGYAQCIQAAGQDITKMQRCAALLKK